MLLAVEPSGVNGIKFFPAVWTFAAHWNINYIGLGVVCQESRHFSMARILLVEDDRQLAFIVVQTLEAHNHVVDSVHDGDEGLNFALGKAFDLLILDWELPGVSGLDICERYRAGGGKAPILFLTGKTDIDNRVDALDTGADDYICKPYSRQEFVARIKAILRRPPEETESTFSIGEVTLNYDTKNATIGERTVSLSRSEFDLLNYFLQSPGRIFGYDEIIEKVSHTDGEITRKSVRQLVARLRNKIDESEDDSFIETVKGEGYRFKR